MSDAAKFDDTPDFSLMLGGPLYQLFLRLRMAKPPLDLLTRRMIIMPLIAWLPLLLMSALGGQVVGGGITVPFLSDVGVHVRFLLALPLLIAAEVIVHQHMRPIVGQLLQRGIVPPDARPRFHACVVNMTKDTVWVRDGVVPNEGGLYEVLPILCMALYFVATYDCAGLERGTTEEGQSPTHRASGGASPQAND